MYATILACLGSGMTTDSPKCISSPPACRHGTGFDPLQDQTHHIFSVIDLYLAPQWEVNLGVGWGLTDVGDQRDHLILKMILGRRFNW